MEEFSKVGSLNFFGLLKSGDMNKVKKVIECIKRYNPQKIIIFGSYTRGETDEYSDLDFVVIKKTKKRFIRRLIEVAKLIDYKHGQVDVFVYTPTEFNRMIKYGNPFIEQVLKEGKVVYEKKKRRSSKMVETS